MGRRRLTIYVTDDEFEAVKKKAAVEGTSVSQYVRHLALGGEALPSRKIKGTEQTTRKMHLIRFSDEEWAALKASAAEVGLSVSAFLRIAAFHNEMPLIDAELVKEVRYELYKQGVNLNQIARDLNSGVSDEEDDGVTSTLSRIGETLERINGLVSWATKLLIERKGA